MSLIQSQYVDSQFEDLPEETLCIKHPFNDIVLFCYGNGCTVPLCKDCCTEHIAWHNQKGTKPQIEVIETIRDKCYYDIHHYKEKFQKELQFDGKHIVGNLQQKLNSLKTKLVAMIDDLCLHCEDNLRNTINLHRLSHQNKGLYKRLNSTIEQLSFQENQLKSKNYVTTMMTVLSQNKNQELEGFFQEIQKQNITQIYDININQSALEKIQIELQNCVSIQQVPQTLEQHQNPFQYIGIKEKSEEQPFINVTIMKLSDKTPLQNKDFKSTRKERQSLPAKIFQSQVEQNNISTDINQFQTPQKNKLKSFHIQQRPTRSLIFQPIPPMKKNQLQINRAKNI